jgi:hypothetical protein
MNEYLHRKVGLLAQETLECITDRIVATGTVPSGQTCSVIRTGCGKRGAWGNADMTEY